MGEIRRIVKTRSLVAEMLERGMTRGAIARALGLSKSTVSYHARRLGQEVDERGARRYEWSAIQAYYDEGHSVRDCMARFGFSSQTWHAAVARGAVVSRPHPLPLADLCAPDTYRSRHNLKLRVTRGGRQAEQM